MPRSIPGIGRHEPLVWVVIFFALGIVADGLLGIPFALSMTVAGAAVIAFLVLFWWPRVAGHAPLALAMVLLASGATYHAVRARTPQPNPLAPLLRDAPRLVAVVGTITDEPRPRDRGRLAFPLLTESIESQEGAVPVKARLQVTLQPADREDPQLPDLRYGDEVRLLGQLRRLRAPTNPGQSDFRTFLRRRGVHATLSVRAGNAVPTGRRGGVWWTSALQKLRRRLRRQIAERFSSRQAAVLAALLVGDRSRLTDRQETDLARSGTMHVLSISGLHIALVAWMVWVVLALTGVPWRTGNVIVILVAFAYAGLTGFRAPAVRAAMMIGLYCFAEVIGRRRLILNSIAAAALGLLIVDPRLIFNAGFQLSFLAVLGLVLIRPRLERWWEEQPQSAGRILRQRYPTLLERLWWPVRHRARQGLFASLAAWLAIMPIIARTFHLVTPVILIANVLLIPLCLPLLLFGFLFLLTSAVHPILAAPVVWLISLLLDLFDGLIAIFADVPGGYFYVPGPSPFWIVVYYAVLLLFVLRRHIGLRLGPVLIVALLVANVYVYRGFLSPRGDELRITTLDVGYGCSLCLEFPNGQTVLCDAGARGWPRVGENVVAPFLWQRGRERIDLLLLSHFHSDHINGVPALLDRFRIGKVVYNRLPEGSRGGFRRERLLARLDLARTPYVGAAAGSRITGLPATIQVLNPTPEARLARGLSPNDNSLVVRIDWRGRVLLLTADVQEAGIAHLLATADDLKADFLYVPHQGLEVANIAALASAVRPRTAVISVRNGQASPRTREAFRSAGAKVRVTGEDGAVVVTLSPAR